MILLAALTLQKSAFTFELERGKGLLVQAMGIPIVQGSLIQFYKPGWSAGYYSSNGADQKITRVDPATVDVSFTSADGRAQGTIRYQVVKDSINAHYDLVWNGDEPAKLEIAPALLWAPPFRSGNLVADGKPARSLEKTAYASEEVAARRFSPDAREYSFSAPVGVLTERSTIPLTLFDGEGSTQDWASGNESFWLGASDLPMVKGVHQVFDVSFQIDLTPPAPPVALTLQAESRASDAVLMPDSAHPPLIPKPMTNRLDWSHVLPCFNRFTFPAGVFDHLDLFKAALARRFQIAPPAPGSPSIAFDAGISKLGLVHGGYKITITPNSISVLGEEDEGLCNGLERLAGLAFVDHGHVCFPTGFFRDEPQTTFRGVHLFVGSQALPFQKKLWTNVLRPLGFNKVVLQCERTHWNSQPGIDTPTTMSQADLLRLFEMYRAMDVDPIPLIQSYGHMQWFFANGKNLDLAADKDQPYAVDPTNPKTRAALQSLWSEAADLLKPDIMHFGLDEIDLVGKKLAPNEKTANWSQQLATLSQIARAAHARMMLWGDQALAPGEAPDAALAENPKAAADRRTAIPKGALIGDWHYLPDATPAKYRNTLQLWKDSGLQPIATTWYRPENIAGFDAEAGNLGCGTLQTTWCGYQSSEANLYDSFEQFTAMVLAADYSWSARTERPEKLGYDPAEVFRKMYFGRPSPLTPVSGKDLLLPSPTPGPLLIGANRYGSPGRIYLPSALIPSGQEVNGVRLRLNLAGNAIFLAINTAVQAPEDGVPVANIVITRADGSHISKSLVYGRDVRAQSDARPTILADRDTNGICSLRLDLIKSKSPITQIDIAPANRFCGLTIHAVAAVN